MEDNLDTWIAKEEAAKRTGLSIKTLERKVNQGELRRAYRNIPNRKPLPIYHPDDIEMLSVRTLKPIPLKQEGIASSQQVAIANVPMSQRQNDIGAITVAMSLSYKVYLNTQEAAQFLGLTSTYMENARKDGTLPGMKIKGVRGFRYHRDTLKRHKVAMSLLAQ